MSIEDNKKTVLAMLDALAAGDYDTMLEYLDPDIAFYVIGSTPYSGLFRGRRALLEQVLLPLGAQRDADGYSEEITRVIGEGDVVVTESRGRKTTTTGHDYNNEYLFIYTLRDGKIVDWRCYLDTQLLANTHR